MNLQTFKTFQADRMDLDDLVSLAAFGALLRQEYEKHQLEEPEFVGVQLKALKREIFTRNAERLEARRKEIDSRLETLKTPTERKNALLREKAKLDKQLQEVGA